MKASEEAQLIYRRRTSARWASLIPAATLLRAYEIWAEVPAPSGKPFLYLEAQAKKEVLDALSYALLLRKVTEENHFGDRAWTSSITGLAAFRCVEVFMGYCPQTDHPHLEAFRNYMKHTAQGLLEPKGWVKDDLTLKISELPWSQPRELANLDVVPLTADTGIKNLIDRYMGN